jgi:hypothetical protein
VSQDRYHAESDVLRTEDSVTSGAGGPAFSHARLWADLDGPWQHAFGQAPEGGFTQIREPVSPLAKTSK